MLVLPGDDQRELALGQHIPEAASDPRAKKNRVDARHRLTPRHDGGRLTPGCSVLSPTRFEVGGPAHVARRARYSESAPRYIRTAEEYLVVDRPPWRPVKITGTSTTG